MKKHPLKPASKHRILIADDHPLFRQGLIQLINRERDLSCCGQTGTVAATQTAVATLKPDGDPPVGEAVWGDTRIQVPESAPRCYQHLLTGRCVPVNDDAGRTWIKAADVFEAFPIGFLEAA